MLWAAKRDAAAEVAKSAEKVQQLAALVTTFSTEMQALRRSVEITARLAERGTLDAAQRGVARVAAEAYGAARALDASGALARALRAVCPLGVLRRAPAAAMRDAAALPAFVRGLRGLMPAEAAARAEVEAVRLAVDWAAALRALHMTLRRRGLDARALRRIRAFATSERGALTDLIAARLRFLFG
jgi:hypothetical protein